MSVSAGSYTYPTDDAGDTLVCIPRKLIPILRHGISELQRRYWWSSYGDWFRAYQDLAELEQHMTTNCLDATNERLDNIYRLLDNIYNGTLYSTTTDPVTNADVISPEIPTVPDMPDGVTAGLRRQLLDMQGVINAGWFGIGGQAATLADVVNALRVGSEGKKQSLLDTISALLAAAGNTAEIFRLVNDLLSDQVDNLGEGAIVGVLIASTMAQAAIASSQAEQIQRIINALDGGQTPAPATNVIAELQQTNTLLG